MVQPYQPGSLPTLPFFLQPVPAGFPSPAEDFIDNTLDLNEHLIKHPSATFFFRVASNSMSGAGIRAGDLLIVDRSLDPYSDAIIVAVLDGELTVRRFKKDRNRVMLLAEADKTYSREITEETAFEVWGVVTSVVHHIS